MSRADIRLNGIYQLTCLKSLSYFFQDRLSELVMPTCLGVLIKKNSDNYRNYTNEDR
jgi:hypothetical protein